jgi:glycosyltransferase involved in cell wall biosynthesis
MPALRDVNGRPRLLILVTLAEAGGAQTFAGALAEGLQHRYEINVGAHGPSGALVDTCERLGIPFHHIQNLRRDPHARRDVEAAVEIRRLVRRLQPDLVQVNSSKAGFIARIALRGMRIPIVYAVHGWAFSSRRGIGSFLFAEAERATARLADAIVCVSQRDRTAAETRRIAPDDLLHVVHNGIAADGRPIDRGDWPERPVLVSTARLAPPKDLLLLLDALAQPGLEAWQLRIVGDGPDRDAIDARRRALGLADRVELLGDRRDVAAQLRAADAFVLPTNSEGLPYSILEAMAAALPVVASNVGGVSEEVVDGITGVLVPRADRGSLSTALRRLHEDGPASRQMGVAGHARVREHFGLDTMVEGYDTIFRGLLEREVDRGTRQVHTGRREPVGADGATTALSARHQRTRPRLLVIVTLAEVGGAQTFVAHLVDGLRNKYEIHVASHGREGFVVDACARMGVPYHHVDHLVREPDLFNDPAAIVELRALVERLRPDLVQLNSSKAGVLARLALFNTVPVVFTAHGWAFARPDAAALPYAVLERAVAPLAGAIVCVSAQDRELALARGITRPEKLHVIHNGVSVADAPVVRGAWPTNPLLACIARLTPQKDVGLLIDALAEGGSEAWRLKVFGDGPDRRAVEQRIAQHGLEARVELCGDVNDVREQLLTCDALALPSNWEGLPFSILEAMGAALPVVASSVGGVPELVVDGETGYLVARGDVHGFAEALARLHASGETARRMGIAGHDRVRREFGVTTMIDRYDDLFRSISRPVAASAPHLLRPAAAQADTATKVGDQVAG